MPRSPRTATGQFSRGTSGNPAGRPPTRRSDSAAPVPTAPAAPAGSGGGRSRRDGWINTSSGHGTARDRRRLTQYGVDIVTDIEAQQLWRSEFLAAAIIEQGPREAFSRGWHVKCEDKELAEKLAEDAKRIGAGQAVVDAAMGENARGGAAIFPVLSGALGSLDEPLDESGIMSVDALHVLEPQELTPTDWYTDIRHPKFRQPSLWRFFPLTVGRAGFVSTVEIHESRLIILPGTRVSVQTQPGQRLGWGDSQLCRPWSVISDFGLAWGSAATLLHNHGKETLEMDGFANIMGQADGVAEFDRYLDAMWNAWSTLRMNVIDGKSKISRATGTLAGVSDLLNEFKVLMAAAARRPVSVLMGQSQSGLRTGDDDTRTWYKTVESDRADRWHKPLERILQLLLLATTGPTGGKPPELWSIEYPSMWSPSDKERADTQLADMQKAKIAVDSGIASADDVAESFYKGDTYSGDIHIDWDRREAQAAVAQQGAGDLSPEDQAAMGGDGELTDEEQAQLDQLQSEFGQ
jgi:phage-related protein (TIGR01555 family)